MSAAIPMRDYVVPGLVSAETVNALLALGGEPMLVDERGNPGTYHPTVPFRAWIRYSRSHRSQGPLAATAQEAADGLLAVLRKRP